jgi:hypothetical protein
LRPLFSEFSYGFGIAREIQLLADKNTRAYPIFPSLVNEKNLGWDVKFRFRGVSLFLQFKRSDYLKKNNAREWNNFNQPYYRFSVYSFKESPQHNCLVDLAARKPHVYYCAPLFHMDADFNKFYLRRRVLGESVWISTRGLPRIQGRQHHRISYTPTHGIFQSEKIAIPILVAEEQVTRLLRSFDMRGGKSHEEISFDYLTSLWNSLREILAKNESAVPEMEFDHESPAELVSALRLVLRTNFGLEWLVFQNSPRS